MPTWKPIKDYEGLYEISNTGEVKSLNLKKGRILKQHIQRSYLYVGLSKQCKTKLHLVHRLVAKTFIPNPLHLPEVNHKDENKLNNNVDNLEWCTHKYNVNYGTGNKRRSKTKINNTYNVKSVQCIETGIIYTSTREAERQTGIDNSQISAVCNHKKNYKTAGGYHWKYIERSDK